MLRQTGLLTSILFLTILPLSADDLILRDSVEETSFESRSRIDTYRDSLSDRDLSVLVPEWERELGTARAQQMISRWLDESFGEQLEGADLNQLLAQIKKNNYLYLYQTDGGRILFDSKGDPLIREVGTESYRNDRTLWADSVESSKEDILSLWTLNARALSADISSQFSSEHKAFVENELALTLEQHRKQVEREMDRLITYSLTGFDYYRKEDNYSLRRKSEDATASALAAELVAETRDEIQSSSEVLSSFSSEEDATVDEAYFSIDQWEESFKREFENGLDKWDRAEQALLSERISWEVRAEEKYLETEKAWNEAFEYFARNRKDWIKEISLELEKGRQIWVEREESFNEQFQSIANELETAAAEQQNKFAGQVESALKIYRESAALYSSADENLSYNLDQVAFYKGKIGSLDASIAAITPGYEAAMQWKIDNDALLRDNDYTPESMDAQRYIKKTIKVKKRIINLGGGDPVAKTMAVRLMEKDVPDKYNNYVALCKQMNNLTSSRVAYQKELLSYQEDVPTWQTLRDSFDDQMKLSRQMLLDLQATAEGYDETVSAGSLQNEIDRMTSLSDNLYLQWRISESVKAYSELNSSLRPTDAQTQKNFDLSETALDQAEAAYRKAVADLAEIRGRLAEEQTTLDAKRGELGTAGADLDKVRGEYETVLAVYRNNNSRVLKIAIENLEAEIDTWFIGGEGGPSRREELYSQYLEASELEARTEERERRETLIRYLKGEESPSEGLSFTDRATLTADLDACRALNPDLLTQDSSAWQLQLTQNGIPSGSTEYDTLSALYDAAFLPGEEEINSLRLKSYLFRKRRALQSRLDWNLASEKWIGLDEAIPDAGEKLQGLKDAESASRASYLEKKGGLLRTVVSELLTAAPSEPDTRAYTRFLMDASYAAEQEDLDALDSLAVDLGQLASGTLTEGELYATCLSDPYKLKWLRILNNDDGVTLPEQELLDLLLCDEIEEMDLRSQDIAAWESFATYSQSLYKTRISEDKFSGVETGGEYVESLDEIDTLDELKAYYMNRTKGEELPDYLSLLSDQYLADANRELIASADLDTTSLALTIQALDEKIEASYLSHGSAEALQAYEDAGYGEEVSQIRLSVINAAWTEYLRLQSDPELADEHWLRFCGDMGLGDLALEDLTPVDFKSEDYGETMEYSSLSGMSVDEFISDRYPGAGFLERLFIKGLITPGDGSDIHERAVSELYSRLGVRFDQAQTELHALQAILSLRSLESRDSDFLSSQLISAYSTFSGEDPEGVTELSDVLYARILSGEEQVKSKQASLEQMERDLEASKKSMEKYKKDVVNPALERYNRSQAAYKGIQEAYRLLIGSFETVQAEFLESQKALDQAYASYQQARYDYQEAREILDYAQCAYSPETMDIAAIGASRKADYEKALAALDILKQIRDKGDTAADVDQIWQDSIDENRDNLSMANILTHAQEELSRRLNEAGRTYENALGEIGKETGRYFKFDKASFDFNEELLSAGLTDCRQWSDDNLEAYFEQDNIDQVYTKDVILWLKQMNASGNMAATLETFSYAYYHNLDSIAGKSERVSGFEPHLFAMEQHKNLLGQKGSGMPWGKSVSIGYEGDVDKYNRGGYPSSDVTKVYRNHATGQVFRVYLEPEAWLHERLAGTYNSVKNNNLYNFYKIMMDQGGFKKRLDEAMKKDLSTFAWYDYFKKETKSEQKRHKYWYGYDRTGKAIRSKRRTIKNSISGGYFSGLDERNGYATAGSKVAGELSRLRSASAELDRLNGDGSVSAEDLGGSIRYVTGLSLSGDQKALLSDHFDGVSASYKTSNGNALTGASQAFSEARAGIERDIAQRTAELAQARNADYSSLIAALGSDDFDADDYKRIAETLYENPVYLAEDYNAVRMDEALTKTPAYSLTGQYNNLESYGRSLIRTYADRMNVVKQDRYDDLKQELADIITQRDYWDERTNELIEDGMVQWNRSTERLIGQRERWRQDFTREYARKEALWQKRYDTLIDNKNAWMTKASRDAVSTGARSMAVDMGFDADQLIGEVSFSLIPDMTTQAGSASDIVSEALCGTTVYRLLDSVRNITSRTGGHDVILSASLPTVPDTTREVANLTEKQNELKEDLQKALAMAQAKQMVRMLNETRETIDESIDDANYDVDSSVDSTLSAAGYARRGDSYDRTVIIDSTLWGNPETERQKVGAYEDFEAPAFDHGIDLSEGMLEDLNSTIIQARVQLAQKNMMNYLNLIFGQKADKDGLDKNFLALLDRQAQAFENSAQYGDKYTDDEGEVQYKHTETSGLFNYHVGYAPVMEKKKPEKVKTDGYGQMGRIYKDYMIQQARLYRGLSTVDAPWYNQKLWDDDSNNDGKSDGFMGAPTVRTLSDIAMTVAASYITPGIGSLVLKAVVGTAMNMADDAIFTALDVDNGMDAGSAWGGFGKKSATTFVTQYANAQMGDLDENVFKFTSSPLGELSSDLAISGSTTAINTYSSAAINSIGSDGFSWNTFNSMTSWDNTGASYLGGLARTGTQGLFDSVFDEDTIKGLSDRGWGSMASKVQNVGVLAGSTAQGLTEYGMTGNTTLNVFNTAMFGAKDIKGDALNQGLFEMHVGKNGVHGNLGTSGIRADYNAIADAVEGIYVLGSERSIRKHQAGFTSDVNGLSGTSFETQDLARLNRMMRAYGDINAKMQAASMLKGKTDLQFREGGDGRAKTEVVDGRRRVYVNDQNVMNSTNDMLRTVVTLSHEAHRDGLDSLNQVGETRRAVAGHVDSIDRILNDYGNMFLKANQDLEQDYNNFKESGNDYVDANYDSTSDYWKLMANGDMVEDGDGWLRDQNGKLIKDKNGNPIGAKGIETGLLNILNGGTSNKAYSDFSDAEIQAAQKLMIDAGFAPSEVENFKNRMWNSGNDGKTIKADSTLDGFGSTVATSVFMNGYDQTIDSILFGEVDGFNLPVANVGRFSDYLNAKSAFYGGEHNIFDQATLVKLRATGKFGPNEGYPDGQHKGIDVGSVRDENNIRKYDLTGTDMSAFFSGKVTRNYESETAGNSVVIEHGFNFENVFYSTGVRSQFMHLDTPSSLKVGSMVSPNTKVGELGSTGKSSGPHLHWQLMGDSAARTHDSSKWDMYQNRRNRFLTQIGGISASNYSLYNNDYTNYWAGSSTEGGYRYNNFYYNTNFMFDRMGLSYE